MPCRRRMVSPTAKVVLSGATPQALYRHSLVSLTRDSWAAADLARPDLLWAARHQISNNHSHQRAAESESNSAHPFQRAPCTPDVLGTDTGI